MAELYHHGVYLRVDVNYLGTFTTHPRSYSGGQKYLVTDMDFAALEYVEFVEFLLRFTGEVFEKVFYCQRNRPLSRGLRFKEDEKDYAHFIDTAYKDPDFPIAIYLDHSGDGLDEWGETSSDDNETVIQGDKQPIDLYKRAHPAARPLGPGGEGVTPQNFSRYL
ncbi:hypothetical protein LXL04_006441 [Taraxacum kok-saghyz]